MTTIIGIYAARLVPAF